MAPLRRTIFAMSLITAMAASVMHMQARALARSVENRQLRIAQATAVTVGGEELIRAEADVRAGRLARGTREVDTRAGRLRVETTTEIQAARLRVVRVDVADESGRLLGTYQTVVEAGGRW